MLSSLVDTCLVCMPLVLPDTMSFLPDDQSCPQPEIAVCSRGVGSAVVAAVVGSLVGTSPTSPILLKGKGVGLEALPSFSGDRLARAERSLIPSPSRLVLTMPSCAFSGATPGCAWCDVLMKESAGDSLLVAADIGSSSLLLKLYPVSTNNKWMRKVKIASHRGNQGQ